MSYMSVLYFPVAFSQTAPIQTEGKGDLFISVFGGKGKVYDPDYLGCSTSISKSISLAP